MKFLQFVSIAAIACLSACGGSGGSGSNDNTGGGTPAPGGNAANFDCMPIGGGSATVSVSCINCPRSIGQNRANAIDTNLDTSAGFSLFNPGDTASVQGQFTVRGTAQDGVIFAAGDRAGLIFGLPVGENVQYTAIVRTFLDGTEQESRNVVTGHTGATNGEVEYFGFDTANPTTMQFDTVAVEVTETLPSEEEHIFSVFEFCGDGGAK